MCYVYMKIGIYNQTEKNLKKELRELKRFVRYIVKKENIKDNYFNIIIVDNKYIKEINRQYRNIDKPTDVISFAFNDEQKVIGKLKMLGDIYISIEKAEEQSKEYGHSLKRELSFLTVHGILHLLGYDHMNEEEEKEMFDKQKKYLEDFKIER